MTLQVSYENIKFAASDVIRADNQSDDFLRMLSKNDLQFS